MKKALPDGEVSAKDMAMFSLSQEVREWIADECLEDFDLKEYLRKRKNKVNSKIGIPIINSKKKKKNPFKNKIEITPRKHAAPSISKTPNEEIKEGRIVLVDYCLDNEIPLGNGNTLNM